MLRAVPGGIEKVLRDHVESFTSMNQYNRHLDLLVVAVTIGMPDHIPEVVPLRV